jgi:hypothetical protein
MSGNRFKYPRTLHLPYSLRRGHDDKVMASDEVFWGKQVVVTEKMDGENTTIYPDYLHARSINSDWDESKRWLDRLRMSISHDMPPGWRICGENLFYKYTIHYKELDTLFYVYSVWNAQNECLPWDETLEWCKLWNLKTIPLLYEGVYAKDKVSAGFQ